MKFLDDSEQDDFYYDTDQDFSDSGRFVSNIFLCLGFAVASLAVGFIVWRITSG